MNIDPVIQRTKDRTLSRFVYNCSATRIDFAESLQAIEREIRQERTAFRIEPIKEKEMSAIDVSLKMLSAIHKKSSRTQSFELWYDGTTSFVFTVDTADVDLFWKLIELFFPEADVTEMETLLLPFGNQKYAASARLSFNNDYIFQILNPNGPTDFQRDPYNEVIEKFNATPEGVHLAFQVAFRRAPENWWTCQRRSFGDWNNSEQDIEKIVDSIAPTGMDDWAKTIISGQDTEKAFLTDLRLIAYAEDPDHATESVLDVANQISQSYEDSEMDQRFRSVGMPSWKSRTEIENFVRREVRTQAEILGYRKRRPTILTLPELAGIAHVPSCISYESLKLTAEDINWKE